MGVANPKVVLGVVNPKGNQSKTLIGRTDAEAETPILGPPGAKERTCWERP